ncbi:hypothetical protein GCM10010495_69230 [Kitasatospora herbaricolor]|uniref:DUF3040 domain-containing protein n=1 Tax=Kitasatospora herbaricolor TaxID=68217 RepID=UPI00174819CE|nr:DUF3040 domain-containing protein [Kitasatospora herbaricolor]MDQ0306243.1 membrane-associated phospholipid phosphatase [Kitasatospora herbaricolor]GGV41768.1 hypothetical protein GCM10010495_69230 [Kitasatospora herbaricolor]
MDASLTDRERRLLDEIELHLRRESPALDRLLRRRPAPLRRMTHRPRVLAALAALLAALTGAGALYAGAGAPRAPLAAAGAGVCAVLLALVFRRLTAVRPG